MRILPALLLLTSLPGALQAHGSHGQGACCDHCQGRNQEKQARTIARQTAEAHTGGQAVSMQRIRINGSTVWGFEVKVHMPGRKEGWRCLVDMDNPPKVYTKYAIPNPRAPKPRLEN
jgi:hypothetical protein